MLLTANGYPASPTSTPSITPTNTTSSMSYAAMCAPDVRMGFTGAPNLWTALHDEDPALQVRTICSTCKTIAALLAQLWFKETYL